MKRYIFLTTLIISFLVFSSCGKKGPILAPLKKIPKTVENVKLNQKGDEFILEWINPSEYVNGKPLSEIDEIEIWLLKKKKKKAEGGLQKKVKENEVSSSEFKNKSALLKTIKKDDFSDYYVQDEESSGQFKYIYEIENDDFSLESLVFGIQVKDKRGKKSDFSELLSKKAVIVPLPPQNMKSAVFEDHIMLEWQPPQSNIDSSKPPYVEGYNVYRSHEDEKPQRLNSELIIENEYSDKDFHFGEEYRYFVRASTRPDFPLIVMKKTFFIYFMIRYGWIDLPELYEIDMQGSPVESSDSNVVNIKPEDTFAPDTPSGFVLLVSGNYLSLSWDRNKEEDLAGYKVWRKEAGEKEYILLTEAPIKKNSFMDTDFEKDKEYMYAVSAVDIRGNESDKVVKKTDQE